jgi:hypothetical protein
MEVLVGLVREKRPWLSRREREREREREVAIFVRQEGYNDWC